MKREIKVGDTVQMNESGNQYKVITVWRGGYYDLKALQPLSY